MADRIPDPAYIRDAEGLPFVTEEGLRAMIERSRRRYAHFLPPTGVERDMDISNPKYPPADPVARIFTHPLAARPGACAVQSIGGQHCPETPECLAEINGEDVLLCRRCYDNIIAGAYGPIRIANIAWRSDHGNV